ncbi:UNVERIFIED_CONTAM: hypothetical protein Slati_3477900 [Sesamum latifolium]|uniref:Uncharacterized protein n=1 Tax=Sesamum latifolium TaxID=2727402 RepID=A0AAW2UJT3_9LAMI
MKEEGTPLEAKGDSSTVPPYTYADIPVEVPVVVSKAPDGKEDLACGEMIC